VGVVSTAIEIVRASDERELLLTRVDSLLDQARQGRESLARNYIDIGLGLLEVKKTGAWAAREHSWDAYVMSCESRFGKTRTALYGYVSCPEQLLPYVSQKQLVDMGVSKAQPLAALVKKTKKRPSDELLQAAVDSKVSVEDFRAKLAEAQHQQPEGKEKWRDLGGFYASNPEWEEIQRAFSYAREIDEVGVDESEMIARKRILTAMARECISSWGPQLEKK
jgi:hypothetical protein